MKTLISFITLGLAAWSVSAQQIQPHPNNPGSRQELPGVKLQSQPYGSQPAVRPSTGFSIPQNQRKNQYSNQRQPNYNNRYPNQQRQNYNTGQYGNNGNNRRFPSQSAQRTVNYRTSPVLVVPWWYTGRLNTSLPHIRQQRPSSNGYGNNFNRAGNQYSQPQYNNPYRNQNGNYARPQTGNQNRYQRQNYGGGYRNSYGNNQRYRTMPSQVGIGVQPRVLR